MTPKSAKNAKTATTAILVGALLTLGVTLAPASHGAELEIRITGMKSQRGLVHYGLYNNAEEFPGGDSIAGDNGPIDGETVVFTVSDLPPGQYAIAAFHDSNGNGEHDVSILRIEDFAFSQDARAIFSAPDFSDAEFTVSEPATAVTLNFSPRD